MTFHLSEEQQTLRSTVSKSFGELATSHFLRSVRESSDLQRKLDEAISSLGLYEYFSEAESRFTDLALIAEAGGFALIPSRIIEALFWGPYLCSRNSSYQAIVRNSGATIEKVFAGNETVSVGFEVEKNRIDFVSTDRASVIVSKTVGLHLVSDSVAAIKVWGPIKNKERFTAHSSLDLTRSCFSLRLEEGAQAHPANSQLQDAWHQFLILISAELAGVASKVVGMTKDYVLTRKQFGAPVGSFQAVQHQLSESYLKVEALDALVRFAASTVAADPRQVPLAAKSSMLYAVQVVPQVVETAIQLHGGIGFTWEYDLHLFLRRVQTLASLYALSNDDIETFLGDAAQR